MRFQPYSIGIGIDIGNAAHDSTGDGDDAAAACEGLVFYTRASSTDEPSSEGGFGPGPQEVAAAAGVAAAGADAVAPLQPTSAGTAGGLNSSSQRQEAQVEQEGVDGEHGRIQRPPARVMGGWHAVVEFAAEHHSSSCLP